MLGFENRIIPCLILRALKLLEQHDVTSCSELAWNDPIIQPIMQPCLGNGNVIPFLVGELMTCGQMKGPGQCSILGGFTCTNASRIYSVHVKFCLCM